MSSCSSVRCVASVHFSCSRYVASVRSSCYQVCHKCALFVLPGVLLVCACCVTRYIDKYPSSLPTRYFSYMSCNRCATTTSPCHWIIMSEHSLHRLIFNKKKYIYNLPFYSGSSFARHRDVEQQRRHTRHGNGQVVRFEHKHSLPVHS